MFTPTPFWINEAYSDAIPETDTGLVMRNISIAKILVSVFYFLMGQKGQGQYLDVGGGYGLLTRIMRDYGFNFYWKDKYCDNLFARGFEFENASGPFNAVTAIELLEHLEDPLGFIKETLLTAKSDIIFFTTELFLDSPPDPDKWGYYSFEAGQHISFFQRRTLEVIGAKLNMSLASTGGIHILSKHPLNQYLLRICVGRFGDNIARFAAKRLGR